MQKARPPTGETLPDIPRTKLRELGIFERFRVVLHDLGFHRNVAIVARYSARRTEYDIPKSLIYFALRHAIYQHPALSVVVAGKDTVKPYFVHIGKIDLEKIVTFEELPLEGQERARRLDEILSNNNSVGFESTELPLWRLVLLGNGSGDHKDVVDIAFIWHHVIGDGRSGLAVLSTILQGMNSANTRNEKEETDEVGRKTYSTALSEYADKIVWPPTKPLLPSLEEILTMPMGRVTTFNRWFGRWVPSWLRKPTPKGKWAGGSYSCQEPIVTKIRHISIPAQSIKRLVHRCREERSTITPLIQTVAGKAILEAIDYARVLRCGTAISLRRFFPADLEIDDTVMGLWVSAFRQDNVRAPFRIGINESGFWDAVRKNGRRIQHEIAKGEKDAETGLLRYTNDFKSMLLAKMGKKRVDSYAITNLGVLSNKTITTDGSSSPPQWVISELLFSQSCHVNGSALQFCIVSVEGGDMSIALSWQEGIVSEEDAVRIADQMRSYLVELSVE